MIEITITLSSRAAEELTKERIEQLVEAEATRLWHIRRSTPKVERTAPIPEATRVGERILSYYEKRRARFGLYYPVRYTVQEARVRELMKLGDVTGLRELLEAQDWTK